MSNSEAGSPTLFWYRICVGNVYMHVSLIKKKCLQIWTCNYKECKFCFSRERTYSAIKNTFGISLGRDKASSGCQWLSSSLGEKTEWKQLQRRIYFGSQSRKGWSSIMGKSWQGEQEVSSHSSFPIRKQKGMISYGSLFPLFIPAPWVLPPQLNLFGDTLIVCLIAQVCLLGNPISSVNHTLSSQAPSTLPACFIHSHGPLCSLSLRFSRLTLPICWGMSNYVVEYGVGDTNCKDRHTCCYYHVPNTRLRSVVKHRQARLLQRR